MLDEPELHLNADLIRSWVAYLTGTVENGQIWLATHSLEAVEAAGQHATFVLERNEETRKVGGLARLDTRPMLSALSRAVGTPAFSISQLLFAFVEGEESVGERERFRKLAGMPQSVRFMECGSCNEVIRRVGAIKALANEAEAGIRIAGIVDRDFRSDAEVTALLADKGVYALPVHEAENFFLHPATLKVLLDQNGRGGPTPEGLIQIAADGRAGCWIFQRTMSTPNASTLPEIPVPAKDRAKTLTWHEFTTDRNGAIQSIRRADEICRRGCRETSEFFQRTVRTPISANANKLVVWKICEGKQVPINIATSTGYSGAQAYEQAVFACMDATLQLFLLS